MENEASEEELEANQESNIHICGKDIKGNNKNQNRTRRKVAK